MIGTAVLGAAQRYVGVHGVAQENLPVWFRLAFGLCFGNNCY